MKPKFKVGDLVTPDKEFYATNKLAVITKVTKVGKDKYKYDIKFVGSHADYNNKKFLELKDIPCDDLNEGWLEYQLKLVKIK